MAVVAVVTAVAAIRSGVTAVPCLLSHQDITGSGVLIASCISTCNHSTRSKYNAYFTFSAVPCCCLHACPRGPLQAHSMQHTAMCRLLTQGMIRLYKTQ